jgi:hypothetical protein
MSESASKSGLKSKVSSSEFTTLKIQFYSTVRNITGVGQIEKQVPKKPLLQQVLIDIQQEYFLPKNAHFLKIDFTDLEPGFICLVDDADFHLCGGIKQILKKDVKITLISSLHGG